MRPMKVRCQQCGAELVVPDEAHYKVLRCPKCGAGVHAVTESTGQISRAFVNEYLKSLEKKPQ